MKRSTIALIVSGCLAVFTPILAFWNMPVSQTLMAIGSAVFAVGSMYLRRNERKKEEVKQ